MNPIIAAASVVAAGLSVGLAILVSWYFFFLFTSDLRVDM